MNQFKYKKPTKNNADHRSSSN